MKLRIKYAFGKRPATFVEADEAWSLEQLKVALGARITGSFELSLDGSAKLEGKGNLIDCGLVNGDLLFIIGWDQDEKEMEDNNREVKRVTRDEADVKPTSEQRGSIPVEQPGSIPVEQPGSTQMELPVPVSIVPLSGAVKPAMDTQQRGAPPAALWSRNNFERLLNSLPELMERSLQHTDVICLAVDSLMQDSGFVTYDDVAKGFTSCPNRWSPSPLGGGGVQRFKYRSVLCDAVQCSVVCVKMESVLCVHASLSMETAGKFSCSLQLPLSAFGLSGSGMLQNNNTLRRSVKDQLTQKLVSYIRKELGLPEVGTFLSLPMEVKLHVLQYLDMGAVLALGAVCKELYQLTKDEFVWKHLFLRQFGYEQMLVSENEQLSWKELYVTQYTRDKEKSRLRAQYYQCPPPLLIGRISPPFPNLPDFPGMIGGSYDLMPDLLRPPVPYVPYGSIPHPPFGDPARITPPVPGIFPGPVSRRPQTNPAVFTPRHGPFGGGWRF